MKDRIESPELHTAQAITKRLAHRPREWSVVVAARVALRALPLAQAEQRLSPLVLHAFRALAVARYSAKYSNQALKEASVDQTFGAASAAARAAASSATSGAADFARAAAFAAASASAVTAEDAASFVDAAIDSAISASPESSSVFADAVRSDLEALTSAVITPEILANLPLWPSVRQYPLFPNWQALRLSLLKRGRHWSIWADWYEDIISGYSSWSQEEDAAFTDIVEELPWQSARSANSEIARRLALLRREEGFSAKSSSPELSRAETIALLADVASPLPSINEKGQLDAGPNKPFDVPVFDEDLSMLPLRQRNLISGILSDLPANAPRHLKYHLRSYGEELKARGAQPILGILKDNADIIAAAVSAANAEDEWLEPGQRKQFELLAENHGKFVEHFPLDAEREKLYSETSVDEGKVAGKGFSEPFEGVAKAAKQAHDAGLVTDDFLAATEGMSETARVVSTLPLAAETEQRTKVPYPDIVLSDDDRIMPVSTKQRVVLNGLGFYSRADQRLADLANMVTIASAAYPPLSTALKLAVDALAKLLP